MTVSVLTLNLWHDSGPWPERATRIREEIAALEPDLIGFQEVLVGGETDLAREIVEPLGYAVAFGAASPWRDGLRFGNSVASRWPFDTAERAELPQQAVGGQGDPHEKRSVVSPTRVAPSSSRATSWQRSNRSVTASSSCSVAAPSRPARSPS